MKVILKQDIKGGGKKDQILEASDGYARNYLFPKGLAVEANAENMSKLKGKQSSMEHKKELEKQEAKNIAAKLKDIILTLSVKAGENGKIFGGITAKEISENLKAKYGIEIDKKKIALKETIKMLGTKDVEIRLYEGITSNLKVKIVEE